jgi:hypothetical protein
MSGRLVAAMTRPSLRVEAVHLDEHLVEGLLALVVPPPMPAPRWRPTASISSMKMIAGAFSLAW